MCGLAGIIVGSGERTPVEYAHISHILGRLLVISERRGPHATGVALIRDDGTARIRKAPVPAHLFVQDAGYAALLRAVDVHTTVLMGHTRWATRGTPKRNANNHPLRTQKTVGSHNGTITNADELFSRLGLRRATEVDSELLFRMADRRVGAEGIDVAGWLADLALCRGDMAAAVVSLTHPGDLLLLRGDRPLVMAYERHTHVLAYASEARILELAVRPATSWEISELPPFSLARFSGETLPQADLHAFPTAIPNPKENDDGR